MQYANIGSGKIIGITSMALDGLVPVPDDARLGDFVEDGKAYTPPNSYSMLSAIKKGAPVWIVDVDAQAQYEIDALKKQMSDIDSQITTIEAKTYRPLREIQLGLDADGTALEKLNEYNTQIEELRTERAKIGAGI